MPPSTTPTMSLPTTQPHPTPSTMVPPTGTPISATTPIAPTTTTPIVATTPVTTNPTLPSLTTLELAYSPHRTHLTTTSRTAISEIQSSTNLPAITLAHSLALVRLHTVDRYLAGLSRDIRAFSYAIEQGDGVRVQASGDGAEGGGDTRHMPERDGVVSLSQAGGSVAGGSAGGSAGGTGVGPRHNTGNAGRTRLSDLSLLHDAVTFHGDAMSEVEDVKTDLRIAMNRRKMEVVEGRVRGVSLGGGEVRACGGDISSSVGEGDILVGDSGGRDISVARKGQESTVGARKTSVEDVSEMSLESIAKLLSLSVEEVSKIPRERLAKMVETQRVVDEVRRKIGEIWRVVGGDGERRRTW